MTKAFILICVINLGLPACGGKDCEQLCTEAQAGDCTSIDGNCGSFCAALDDVDGDAGCTDERDAYEDCLNSDDAVCDASCGGAESALSSCITAYCIGHAGDPSCVTLAGSF